MTDHAQGLTLRRHKREEQGEGPKQTGRPAYLDAISIAELREDVWQADRCKNSKNAEKWLEAIIAQKKKQHERLGIQTIMIPPPTLKQVRGIKAKIETEKVARPTSQTKRRLAVTLSFRVKLTSP